MLRMSLPELFWVSHSEELGAYGSLSWPLPLSLLLSLSIDPTRGLEINKYTKLYVMLNNKNIN